MHSFKENPTRYLFFTGKGGVGKTSIACATAVTLADNGKKILLISTDPASNLGQVFQTSITDKVSPIPSVQNLSAINIDPEKAAANYRDRAVNPVKGLLPEEEIEKIREQLSGACTTEVASFDEFTQFLVSPRWKNEFDHIIFDTAPTGHTLRLLSLPAAWSKFIDDNPDGASCLGPQSALQSQRGQYETAVKTLNDPLQTTLILVSRPEKSALAEAERSSNELKALGIGNQLLVLNGVFESHNRADEVAKALQRTGRESIAAMPTGLKSLPVEQIPLKGFDMIGPQALRNLFRDEPLTADFDALPIQSYPDYPGIDSLLSELEANGKGLIMLMGKGGVGKTTMAAAVAVYLARKGHKVHLSTTDPAAHLEFALNSPVENLTVDKIDPKAETGKYIDQVMKTKGRDLDEEGRKLLLEDLQSPCTEEVAVFNAFSGLVREAARQFVVLDTAPTGHTLLLLDRTGAYHKDVMRNSSAGKLTTPFMRLQDPDYTRLIIVAHGENTPVLEAKQLQDDLRRAGIEPYAWIINKTYYGTGTTHPILRQRIQTELLQIEKVKNDYCGKLYVVPFVTQPLIGADNLEALYSPKKEQVEK